jgi:tetratricopeptide (TPR) repeat protein
VALLALCAQATAQVPADEARIEALLGLARVKRDQGDTRAARTYFEQARALQQFDAELLDEYYWVLVAADPAAARAVGDRVLELDPSRTAVRDRQISFALEAGDEARVQALARAGEHLFPQAALWPRRLAESHLRQQRFADAASALQHAVAARDATRDDRALYAVVLESAGDRRAALAAWGKDGEVLCAPKPEWCASRLRVMAAVGDAATAAPALERWMSAHPDDDEMRGLLAETYARAERPEEAIAALQPLKGGSARVHWLRREYELTQGIGDRDRIVAALTALTDASAATHEEQWMLAELLVDARSYDRARRVIVTAARQADPCDERPLRMLEHLPRGQANDDFLRLIGFRPPACPSSVEWRTTAARRATAAGMLRQALELLDPVATGLNADTTALYGQLLLWTGAPDRAVPVLDEAVARGTAVNLDEARLAAYRASGKPLDAWVIARRQLASPQVPVATRLEWATLAIEAGAADEALVLAREAASDPVLGDRARSVEAHALAASGRTAEALASFERLSPRALQPQEALAWLLSVEAVSGPVAALAASDRFDVARDAAWVDVLERQAIWRALAGPPAAAAELRAAVAQLSPDHAALVDAEVALRQERPADAVPPLRQALASSSRGLRVRAADLMSVALAGAGDYTGAVAMLRPLMTEHPDAVAYQARDAEWTYRARPAPAALERALDLAKAHPDSRDARLAAARLLVENQRYAEALTIADGGPRPQSVEERVLVAACQRSLGRHADALARLEGLGTDPRAALLHAQLLASVKGPEAAELAFQRIAASSRAATVTYLAWADAQSTPRARARVLVQAQVRFPDSVDVAAALASAWLQAGEAAQALDAAEDAVGLDPHRSESWFVLLDATLDSRGRDALDEAVNRFESIAGHDPALILGVARQLAGYARGPDDPLVTRAIGWIDQVIAVNPALRDARIAKANVLLAAERWNEAIEIADTCLAADASDSAALRVRAEALAYSGEYERASVAFDTLVAAVPDDLSAARLRARVAGWAGRYEDARLRYDELVREHADHAAVRAEAAAKEAFYAGRWREAATQYRRWLELEPKNREAAFELAQALQAIGDQNAAVALYRSIASGPQAHRTSADALARVERQQAPSASPYATRSSSDGYGGQLLIDWSEAGATFAATPLPGRRARLAVEGAAVSAESGAWRRTGYKVAAAATLAPATRLAVDVDAALVDIGQQAGASVEGGVGVTWRSTDRFEVVARAGQSLVVENGVTVDTALMARGGSVAGVFSSRALDTTVRGRVEGLSDGNTRRAFEWQGGWTLRTGRDEWRATTWNQWLGYARRAPAYFSPASFWRTDVGAEWRRWLTRPRFMGDREGYVAAAYALGFDSNGEIYHHPAARIGYEFASGLAIEARGSWLSSPVYTQTEGFVGLRVGGQSIRGHR